MEKAAKEKGVDVEIEVLVIQYIIEEMAHYNCCLLGPQIKYKLADFQPLAQQLNKPIIGDK